MELIVQIFGLILTLIGIGTIIWKSGQHNQKISGKMENVIEDIQELKAAKDTNRENIEKSLSLLQGHIADNSRHIDVRMEEILAQTRKEQLTRIEHQLEQLLLTNKSK